MISLDWSGQSAVVTGGTRGLGKAIAMELSRTGATVFVTHRWGSVEESALAAEFAAEGLPAPTVVESDASDGRETRALLARVPRPLRVVVSNVAFAKVVGGLDELKKHSLDLSLAYSTWPLVDLAQACLEVHGRFPRYLIAVSGGGGQVCWDGYDLAGVSKSALETLVRYLAVRLKTHGVRVNAIRPGPLDTQNAAAAMGQGTVDEVRARLPEAFLDPRRAARTCVALASGLFDAVTGQTIVVDEGWSLLSPANYLVGRDERFVFPPDDET